MKRMITSGIKNSSIKRLNTMARKAALCLICIFSCLQTVSAQVEITSPIQNLYPCPSFPTAYYTLTDIVIRETSNTDFSNGTNVTFILQAPANFEFATGAPLPVISSSGPNIGTTASLTSITTTQITLTFTVSGATGGMFDPDQIRISGLRVRGVNTFSGNIIQRNGGTAVINGSTGVMYGALDSRVFPTANAGPDQLVCATTATMDAFPIPSGVTGVWTVVSGPASVTTPSSPTSGVTGLDVGINRFRWTISAPGGCTSYSEMIITRETAGFACSNKNNEFSAVTNIAPGTATCTAAGTKTEFTLANPGPFNVGEKVLIIQMQGAEVNTGVAVEPPTDAVDLTFGSITNYNGAGNYEFAYIDTKVGSVVTFIQPLTNTYNVAGKVQLVTVPQYATHNIPINVTGTAWNGTTGGVMVFDVVGTLTLNGNISMDGRGFAGGARSNFGVACNSVNSLYMRNTSASGTAFRGHGIHDFGGFIYGRGALASGGGSGGGHNSGGGGGSNAGAGGRGGFEYSSCYDDNATYPKPYNGIRPVYKSTTIVERRHGRGGYALSPDGTRIFMGGGGGGGNGDDGGGGAGGAGGGIIIISAGEIAGTSGVISANGIRGEDNGSGMTPLSNPDAAGSGGAGGTILLNVGAYSIGSLTVSADGGRGGDNGNQSTCHGTGAGGGGGLVWTAGGGVGGNVTRSSAGGRAGLAAPNSPLDVCHNSNYGSTAGGSISPLNNLLLNQTACCSPADLGPDQPLCGAGSIELHNGTLGASTNKYFTWYLNGNVIAGATDPTYTATQPGTYSVRVDSVAGGYTFCTSMDHMMITSSMPVPILGADQIICDPAYVDLAPENLSSFPDGTTWQWMRNGVTLSGETTPYLYNVREDGIYRLTATAAGCPPTSDEIIISSSTMPSVTDACRSDAGTLTLSASGGNGGPYQWYDQPTGGTLLETDNSYTTPSLSTTTTYYVQDNATISAKWGATESQTIGNGGSIGNTSGTVSQVFTVFQTCTLYACTINVAAAATNGTIRVNVRSGPGPYGNATTDVIGFKIINPITTVTNGFYRVQFDSPIILAPGTYSIDPYGSSMNLFFRTLGTNITGVSYPLIGTDPVLGNIMQFDRTNDPTMSARTTRWACFYDYEFTYVRPCARVPVIAEIGGSCALPVELLHFSGENKNDHVLLTWATASEINNDYFTLQRSVDGFNFENIGTVKGRGTSHEVNHYQYKDPLLNSGTLYYRLVQTDIDGTSKTSHTISVQNNKEAFISVYPNPFSSGINLTVNSMSDFRVDVKIMDLSGRTLYHSDEHLSNSTITLGENLQPGMYMIEVRTEYEMKVFRVLKSNN